MQSEIKQYASINPQGEAPFLVVENHRGVWVGEAGQVNLTFNENNGSDSIVVTDVATKDGCSVSSPCYITTNYNPCLTNSGFKSTHVKFKK